jgi:hypothetical protein
MRKLFYLFSNFLEKIIFHSFQKNLVQYIFSSSINQDTKTIGKKINNQSLELKLRKFLLIK